MWNFVPSQIWKTSACATSSSSPSCQPVTPLLADGLRNLCHAFRSWVTLIQWLSFISSMSSRLFLLGLPFTLLSSLGIHSVVILAHSVEMSFHAPHFLDNVFYSNLWSYYLIPDLVSFGHCQLPFLFCEDPSLWANIIAGKMTMSMIFLFGQIGILLSLTKWLYSPNRLHPWCYPIVNLSAHFVLRCYQSS